MAGRVRDALFGVGGKSAGRVLMCSGDDRNCPDFELHRQKLLDDLDAERRRFLKSAFVAPGGAAALAAPAAALVAPAAAQTVGPRQGKPSHHYVPATAETVHW